MRKMMRNGMGRKLCILALAGAMAASFAGCGSSASDNTEKAQAKEQVEQSTEMAENMNHVTPAKKAEDTPEKKTEDAPVVDGDDIPGGEIVGGWTKASSMKITDAHKELFKKAQETLAGAVFTPVALLSTQVVAGTNYRFLCRKDASVAELNAKPVYSIVTIYEELDGNASITEILDSEVEVPDSGEMMTGAFEQPEDLSMTAEATKAFDLATGTITGMEYKAVAMLGTQVVAGTNYRILCEAKASTAGGETGWAILTVYADLEGNAEVIEIAEMKQE